MSTKSVDVRLCSDTTVTDASLAMDGLASEADQAGDESEADELQRLRGEMGDAQDRFDDESKEQSEEILDRLNRERHELEDRLRDSAALPGPAFANAPGLCPASPFVRRRVLLPREALLLAQRS